MRVEVCGVEVYESGDVWGWCVRVQEVCEGG